MFILPATSTLAPASTVILGLEVPSLLTVTSPPSNILTASTLPFITKSPPLISILVWAPFAATVPLVTLTTTDFPLVLFKFILTAFLDAISTFLVLELSFKPSTLITSFASALAKASFNSLTVVTLYVVTACIVFNSPKAVSLPFPPIWVTVLKFLVLVTSFCIWFNLFPTIITGESFLAAKTPTANASIRWSSLPIPSLAT